MVNQNKGNPRKPEIRLSIIQVIILAGFCLGCMAASYILGLITGQRAGYQTAFSNNLAATAKIPLSSVVAGKIPSEAVTDVYKNLDSTSASFTPTPASLAQAPAPELAPIEKISASAVSASASNPDTLAPNPLLEKPKATTPQPEANQVWAAKAGTESAKSAEKSTLANVKVDEGSEEEDLSPLDRQIEKKLAEPKATATPTNTEKEKAAKEKALKEKLEKEKAEKEKKEKISEPQKNVSKGWYAQVAAPKELKDADAIAAKLRRSGFRVVIESAEVRGENYYRLLVGPEKSQEQANRLVGQLKRENYLSGEPFVKMVR